MAEDNGAEDNGAEDNGAGDNGAEDNGAEDAWVVHTTGPASLAGGVWLVPRRDFARGLLGSFEHRSWQPLLDQAAVDLPRCRCAGPRGEPVVGLDALLDYALRRRHPRLALALATQACLAGPVRDLAAAAWARGAHLGEPPGGGAHAVTLGAGGHVRVEKTLRVFRVGPGGDDETLRGPVRIAIDVELDGAAVPVVVTVNYPGGDPGPP